MKTAIQQIKLNNDVSKVKLNQPIQILNLARFKAIDA
jgi:hypothetical protein